MANIRKSFSFRNGVQVDDDDLVVRGSLVGIGTTVPTETLDVRGTTKLVGFTTMVGDFQVSGVSTFANKVAIGTQVSISGGIVTANYFYGDGSSLSNLPTSQWIDVDVGLGFTSIYAAGNVGVGTTDPQRLMQIGGNPDRSQSGTVFDRLGNIFSTGIITATSFVGFGSGITQINASNISTGTLGTSRLPVIPNDRLSSDISVTGVITATGGFVGNIIGNVTGNLVGNVTGNVTGNLVGIATTARGLTGTPDIIVGVVTATSVASGSLISSGIVSTSTLAVGASGTVFNVNASGRIGIGSAIPSADLQLVRSGAARVEVISNTGESSISVGQTVGTGNSVTLLRFGNDIGSFDIVNRSTGSISNYLHAGSAGINTGRFSWVYGQTNNELMSLTYDGRLGLGITNPAQTLHVVGTSTVTSNSFVGGTLRVLGSIFVGASGFEIGGAGEITNNVFVTTGVSTFAQINVTSSVGDSRIGIGTSAPISGLDGREITALFGFVGVGTTAVGAGIGLKVNDVAIFDRVGLGTTSFYDPPGEDTGGALQVHDNSINIYGGSLYLENSSLGIGTNAPRAIADFGTVGAGQTQLGYLLLPSINQGLVVGLTTLPSVQEGGILFNTTSKRFQGYNGTAFNDFVLGNTIGYAATAGVSTSVSGGTASVTQLNVTGISTLGVTSTTNLTTQQVNVSGVSTFAGITTVTGTTLFAKQLNVSGVVTASQFIRQSGTSSQFLKADGSVDSSTYLTSYTETSTLANVTSRGNVTTNGISVGVVTATRLEVGTGVTVSAGIVTATNGFLSGIGTAVRITTVGNQLVFTVPGVGSTSFTLF